MVNTSALLVPPLVQPRLPEFPLGVFAVTLTDSGAETKSVVIVACIWVLLVTLVVRVVPLMTTTEEETK